MPVQLTLRHPKGGAILAERVYDDGYRIDAVSGWLVVVDRNGSVVAAHAACPGLEGRTVEHASAAASPHGDDEDGDTGPEPDPDDRPYLDDAEEYGTAGDLFALSRSAGHAEPPTQEVVALHRIDRLIGNRVHLGPQTLGRVRRVVLDALNDWHGRQRAEHPDPPRPDPETRPAPAAWNEEPRLGGPEADAEDPLDHTHDGCEANLDALRAEVARLTGLLDDAGVEADRADEATSILTTYRREVDEQTARAEREHAERLRLERLLAERNQTIDTLRGHLDAANARAERAEGLVDEDRPGETVRAPIEEDPRRPHSDSWPDDAVLLRYAELRRLVSLHLGRYGDARSARAMLDGDVPLRLSEVLA
jgi:hypothetical protein